jgi:hypothetical protein
MAAPIFPMSQEVQTGTQTTQDDAHQGVSVCYTIPHRDGECTILGLLPLTSFKVSTLLEAHWVVGCQANLAARQYSVIQQRSPKVHCSVDNFDLQT